MNRTRQRSGPWYEGLGVVSIGGQSGGPGVGGVGRIKVELWRLLGSECSSAHCPAIAHYAAGSVGPGRSSRLPSPWWLRSAW